MEWKNFRMNENNKVIINAGAKHELKEQQNIDESNKRICVTSARNDIIVTNNSQNYNNNNDNNVNNVKPIEKECKWSAEQKEIIEYPYLNSFCIQTACAGAGKSSTCVARIMYCLDHFGVD